MSQGLNVVTVGRGRSCRARVKLTDFTKWLDKASRASPREVSERRIRLILQMSLECALALNAAYMAYCFLFLYISSRGTGASALIERWRRSEATALSPHSFFTKHSTLVLLAIAAEQQNISQVSEQTDEHRHEILSL